MKQGNIIIKNASQLVTCSGHSAKKGEQMSDLSVIENGTVVITDGLITYVGKDADCPPLSDFPNHVIVEAEGKAVLPGFVDSHTHFIFGGYREEEFSWRMRGDSYMSIMEHGGGIHNTMTATRNASLEDLLESGRHRLDKMLAMGVTTVEGKSGYGMNKETELKQLEAMKALNKEHPVDIVSTFMGAHATPNEYKGRVDDFLDYMIKEVMPEVKDKNLAECCDIFCEKNVFDIEQSRRYLTAARDLGFKLKIHADEIVTLGGAELAAELKALSADHLLQASDKGIECLAGSNTVATLLPCTAFSLKEHYARGRHMIDMGCAVALATDLNPGSSFTNSIPLLFALACIYMQLSPEEAVTALTINGAAAIGKADKIGSIDVGKQGDLVILEYPSYKFLPYHIGMNIVEKVIKRGILFPSSNI
ncbi:imidazolonepropionase [Dysgonomonas sp. Marseille-P4677]|uniref:imidazolonepropionase n=1 Tax=Dysgonomonas sp. Marseille-P4677 TaxID=2364790 RepID=UPI001914168A|nr:imidazolonepropionase [Dysgonomonas sp. Marseille-P4677]MBK5721078.1 imidazolonepropionase [Dysgonomonas sp. Marseille-P4677]